MAAQRKKSPAKKAKTKKAPAPKTKAKAKTAKATKVKAKASTKAKAKPSPKQKAKNVTSKAKSKAKPKATKVKAKTKVKAAATKAPKAKTKSTAKAKAKAKAKSTPKAASKTKAAKTTAKAKKAAPKKTVAKKTPPKKATPAKAPKATAVKKAPEKKAATKPTPIKPKLRARQAPIDSQPREFKPYAPRKNEDYMNEEQRLHFREILMNWKRQLMEEVDRTVSYMKDAAANDPDPADRATQEEEFSLELRTRDRERRLIKKIDNTIDLIDQNDYGYCESCGIEIGIRRLEARPTATQCIDCKTLDEIKEKQILG